MKNPKEADAEVDARVSQKKHRKRPETFENVQTIEDIPAVRSVDDRGLRGKFGVASPNRTLAFKAKRTQACV